MATRCKRRIFRILCRSSPSTADRGSDIHAQGGKYGNAICMMQMLLDTETDIDAQGAGYGSVLSRTSKRGCEPLMHVVSLAKPLVQSRAVQRSAPKVLDSASTSPNPTFGRQPRSRGP